MENTDKIITEETNLVIPEHVALIQRPLGEETWTSENRRP